MHATKCLKLFKFAAQYLFNERLLQNAAGILYDSPALPDIEIPAAADPAAMPSDPELRPGRRRAKRRAAAAEDGDPTESLLGGDNLGDHVEEGHEQV